jgi:lipopolysaccharide export system permease protein
MILISAIFLLQTGGAINKSLSVFFSVFLGFVLFSVQKLSESFALTEQVSLHLVAFGPSIASILLFSGILLHVEDG